MRTRSPVLPRAVLAAALVCATALIGAGTAAATPTVSVVAKGLDSPRHLTFGPGGDLYVAIAGIGGLRERHYNCTVGVGTEGAPTRLCHGASSAVDEITPTGTVTQPFKDFPSVQELDTHEVTGIEAVAFRGHEPSLLFGNVLNDAVGQTALAYSGGGRIFGYLNERKSIRVARREVVRRHGKLIHTVVHFNQQVFDGGPAISDFAITHPQSLATLGGLPGETPYDSDPSDVVSYQGGDAVTDAGANDVLLVDSKGGVSLAARLPTETETAPVNALYPGSPAQTIAAQAVPSSVTVGPDGALYVGVLRGVPGPAGSAAVYRVVPGQTPVAVVTGLTRVSDLAFTPQGNLLILESNTGGALALSSTPGALLTATPNGTTPVTATDLGVPGLVDPTGLAVDADGDAYISNHTTGAHRGQVIKVSGL